MQFIFECVAERWVPMMGDLTVSGWLVTAGYGVAGLLMLSAGLSLRAPDRMIWVISSLFLLLLMINKQLDFHTALTSFGRCHALVYGWYDDRRLVQAIVIGVFALIPTTIFIALLFFKWRLVRHNAVVMSGSIMLLFFILIRAFEFHHLGALLQIGANAFQIGPMLEICAIALFIIAALHKRKHSF